MQVKKTYHQTKNFLAKNYATFLQKRGTKIIGITGSAGKTTTKEMVASILSLQGTTTKSYKNIDPIYNIASTILKTPPWAKYVVIELGVRKKGEMKYYGKLIKPDIGIFLNVSNTHTEFFKNERGVLNEKKEIFDILNKNNLGVVTNINLKKHLNTKKAIYFGKNTKYYAKNIKINNKLQTEFELNLNNKKINVNLPILGKQFVENALAAATAADLLGIQQKNIKKGLENFEPPEHRMRIVKHKSGAIILDDSYNSNPKAVLEAIDTLKLASKATDKSHKIAVLGDMLELGGRTQTEHNNILQYALENTNAVITVGKLFPKNKKIISTKDYKEAISQLNNIIDKNSIVLIKGSRGIQLDKMICI